MSISLQEAASFFRQHHGRGARRAVRRMAGQVAGLAATSLLVAAAGVWGAEEAEAQVVTGVVVEQLSGAAVRGAVVTVYQESESGDDLSVAAVTRTDDDGSFIVELGGPGAYRAQADMEGLTSPLSDRLDLGADVLAEDLVLMVPSPLLLLAYQCQAESEDGVTVVGVALDPQAEVVLPDVRVEARWEEDGATQTLSGTTDAAGRYRICGIPPSARFVMLQGQLLGRMSTGTEVEVSGSALVLHDVELAVSQAAGVGAGNPLIQEQILREAAARGLGDLSGELVDQLTGQPIQQAVVRIQGTPLQALTGEEGRFTFRGVQPGRYLLEIRHLGYNVESDPVDVAAGQDVLVRMQVAPQAVELAGIEVSTRSAAEQLTRLTPFRRDIVYGAAMADEEHRGARAFEILRRNAPGLRVVEQFQEGAPPVVCIFTNRRVGTLGGGGCPMVEVIIDGVRTGEGPELLRNLPASEIESIEYVTPTQAAVEYGTGGNTSNGVVVVFTRGRGPYTSPLRNRPPGG